MTDNQLHPLKWIPASAQSVLDVGCNTGDLLAHCEATRPTLTLAGVDVNAEAINTAQRALPSADIRHITGTTLPFDDSSFDCVTFIEVIEHIPSDRRAHMCREVWRVLRPGGTLVIRAPHKGWFSWLDSNNLRFRYPRLYRALIGKGMRDRGYANGSAGVVWHHHFTRDELIGTVGDGFTLREERYGGLVVFPLGDIARWPFYRKRIITHPLLRMIDAAMEWDAGVPYGRAAFTILLVFTKSVT